MVARVASSPACKNITAILLQGPGGFPTKLANSYRDCCDGLLFSCNFFRSAFPKALALLMLGRLDGDERGIATTDTPRDQCVAVASGAGYPSALTTRFLRWRSVSK